MTVDKKQLRGLAQNTLEQTGPNVVGSAAWFRARASDLAQGVAELLEQLDIVTTARDEARARCHNFEIDLDEAKQRIADLTKVAEVAASKAFAAGKLIAAAELEAMTKARDELADIAEGPLVGRVGDIVAMMRSRIAELRKVGAKENEQVSAPVCATCNDTHRMTYEDREILCTRCPRPCRDCASSGGSGAYCAKTPCGCECHRRTR